MAVTDEQVTLIVSWNGGWDKYLVDKSRVREITEEEANSLFPQTDDFYLLCKFDHNLTKEIGADKAVKILERLGGGD